MSDARDEHAQPDVGDTLVADDPAVEELAFAGLPDLGVFRSLGGYRRDLAYMRVEREVRRLQALQAMLVGEVARSCSFVDEYHHTPAAWLRAVTNSSKTTTAQMVAVAAMFRDLPAVAAAASRGEIGSDQLRLLARLHANPRVRDLLPDSEELLLGYAIHLTFFEFRQVCDRWLANADPDGAHHDHQASRENRHVRSHRVGAGHIFHAEGDATTMGIVDEILARHADAEFNTDIAERLARFGADADKYPLARTARQRLYDAFIAICLKAAGTKESTDREPLITIVCTETVLTNAIREFFGQPGVSTGSERMRLCETVSGAPVDPHDLVIAALIGQVQRLVVDPAGRPIHLGRRQRLFSRAAREAVLLTGDRCIHPGCELRTGRIQIDHTTPWALLGGTDATNGGPVCPRHNRAKHTGRYTVTRDQHGWHHHRPDGTEIAPRGS